MVKLILLFCGLFLLACNNQSSAPSAGNRDTATSASATPASPHIVQNLSKESELEILAGCVDNAKAQLGDQNAYALCKCVLAQVQRKYPGADSTAIVAQLSDTAQVAQMAQQCK